MLAVGFNEVQEKLRWEFAMPRSAGSQKQQRVFFAYRVRFFDFAKQFGSVRKLRFEFSPHLFADFVAATPDAGTDRGLQIAWPRSEITEHLTHALFYDAFHGAAPSGVKHARGVSPRIHQNYGKAVRSLDSQKDAWSCGNQPIAGNGVAGNGLDAVDDVGMDLAQCDQGPRFELVTLSLRYLGASAQCTQESSAIALHNRCIVVLRETEIKVALAVRTGETSKSRGKPVDEPSMAAQMGDAQNSQIGFWGRQLSHKSIITDDPYPGDLGTSQVQIMLMGKWPRTGTFRWTSTR